MTGPAPASSQPHEAIVGREPEQRILRDFVEGEGAATCLVLWGEPGIGKTTLWELGIRAARDLGYQVLSTRGSEAEASLSFAALADLVDGIDEADLCSLPAPQLRALEVTLRRSDPVGAPPDRYAVSAGFLTALGVAARRGPLLLAIDDIQWLDDASVGPLLFAARRLPKGCARFLVTRRGGRASTLERVLDYGGFGEVEVTALSLGAMGRVLSDRLGLTLSRHALRQVHDASQGNPLFALEMGRLLRKRGIGPILGELPLPDLGGDLFAARIGDASESARRILLAVALSGGLRPAELARLVNPLAIEDAVAAGLLVIEESGVRPANPMLGAAARRHASASERRALHGELASAVTDPILHARHLAIATQDPDAEIAGVVANAAELAAGCGRVSEAVELAEHALRLTPRLDPASCGRVVALARLHSTAGQPQELTGLLASRMSEMPPGRCLAQAHLLLADWADADAEEDHLEQALAEARDDPDVRALVLSRRATQLAAQRVERIDEAETWALYAVSAAQSAEFATEERATVALAWCRILRGQPVDHLWLLVPGPPGRLGIEESAIDRPEGVRMAFRGELEQATAVFSRLLALAEQRGELRAVNAIQFQLCEVALRAGHQVDAARLLADFEDLLFAIEPDRVAHAPYVARVRALMAAMAGDPAETARWAARVLDSQQRAVNPESPGWDRLEAERALGIAALFDHDTDGAVRYLSSVWQHTRREHVDDPGAFPVAGDLVEALVEAGRFDEASEVLDELRRLSVDQEHPWGLATTNRGEALVRLAQADGYLEDAADALGAAASTYGEHGLDFDHARSLLTLGAIQRRFKKRGAARSSLEQSAEIFTNCGSVGWVGRARQELTRVSGRRSAPEDQLTPTEQRVVSLAAEGMANKEIARRLFVSVNTVEGHLSRAYAKLGVVSRGQLARRLGDRSQE